MSEALFTRELVEHFAREGFARGWSEALDAAREAVAAVPHGISVGTGLHIHRERALAAIDALREERSDD